MAAISMGTALAVGALSSAAGGGVKAIVQSRAAKKAAEQQAQGAREASGYMRQGLGQLQQLYQPYINSGAGAMGTLGRLTTPGPGARFASGGPPNAMPQQPPEGTGMAMPRMGGGVRGPYMMADGGDVMVDRPTMFIAGEAGPERASFQPMSGGPRPAGRGVSEGIRANLLAKYGPPGGQPGGGQTDPNAMRAAMGARAGGLQGFLGAQRQMPTQGAGGWGGTFAQMGPRMPPPGGPMGAPPPPQGGPMGPMGPPMAAGGGGQRPPMLPQWAPEPPQGWGYY